ncbi:hypothetical protein I1A62_14665 [Rhodococcus sp. USK10]|uniref:Uncharacterized protein n=1 Tax=Rhodococcus pseudokoreensis TaxID=2811421 RepID=A0A974WA36_9NOCA|nr:MULTISPECIES: hypothetical protein [Rhodococcus]QSE93976.1 hypothetical protein JWS13_37935 [Rhodococcus pseudokoreensis]QYB05604.1 hypothetical protein I1A62_14665 [Rhodococcus sp. USK10]
MDDRTVAIGALAIATVSAVSGLMIGAAGGAFGSHGPAVAPPPLSSEGLQAAGPHSAEPATFQVFVPPTPTWQMAELTTPRAVTLTTEPAPVTTAPPPAPSTTPAPPPPPPVRTTIAPPPPPPPPTISLAPVTTPVTRPPVVTTTEATVPPQAAVAPTLAPTTTTTTTTRPVITIPPVTTRPRG